MSMKFPAPFILIVLLLISSCKKDKSPEVVQEPDVTYIAPCEIDPLGFDSMEVHYDGGTLNPQALYRLTLRDTNANGHSELEVVFIKIPESGIYQIVETIDTSAIDLPNQIAFVGDSGSFLWRSVYIEGAKAYVEKNNDEITISYCTIPGNGFQFNPAELIYEGNPPGPFKINMKY